MPARDARENGEDDARPAPDRSTALVALRATLARREARGPGASVLPDGRLPLGVPAIDAHLRGGLALGALHEIAPAEEADAPAALGFLAALMARLADALPERTGGDMLLVVPDGDAALDGHGLAGLGLPPERVLLLRVGQPRAALWALEEGLRAGAFLSAVVGLVEGALDLTASRRLQLAAEASGPFLAVLRPAGAGVPNAAATRWRIGTAPAWRDRFGTLERPRWQADLTRCRAGRPGHWLLEWDHAARRLGLGGGLGDRAPPRELPDRRRA